MNTRTKKGPVETTIARVYRTLKLKCQVIPLGLQDICADDRWPTPHYAYRYIFTNSTGGTLEVPWRHGTGITKGAHPSVVLAYACNDARDVDGRTFEEYAEETGADEDSRKAERVYLEIKAMARALTGSLRIPAAIREDLAEYANEL